MHLNGRVYDPLVGRMMSADPFIPDPMNAQAWNRYAYVINNPLAFTDPNGYCWLSTFLDRSFGVLFRDVPILGTLFEIAAVGLCTVATGGNPVCAVAAFGSTTFVTGVTSGNLGYALRAGLVAGVTAMAFYEVGELTGHTPSPFDADPSKYFENVAGHALVGCASAEASGGKCGPAALAGGITSAAAPFINGPNFAANIVTNSVLGGLASVAGGGKFANGAITGAFGYLFNACANSNHCTREEIFGGKAGGAEGTYSPLDLVGGGAGLIAGGIRAFGAAVLSDLLPGVGYELSLITGAARSIAGYQVTGTASLVGSTYTVTVWDLAATEESQGLRSLSAALMAEASAAGAAEISIIGRAVVNPGFMNPALAARFGFTFTQVNSSTIMLQAPIQ